MLNVLVVGDSSTFTNKILTLLQQTGDFNVECEYYPCSALQNIEKRSYDAVIATDCLPISFLRYVQISNNTIPVIFVAVGSEDDSHAILFEMAGVCYAAEPAQIVMKIREAMHHEDIERQLTAERDLALKLLSSSSVDESMALCLNTAIAMSGMDCGAIFIVDEDKGNLRPAYSTGVSEEFISAVSHYQAESEPARVFAQETPVYTKLPKLENSESGKISAVGVIPIFSSDNITGYFAVGSHTRDAVPEKVRAALEKIAVQAGSVLDRIKTKDAVNESRNDLLSLFNSINDCLFVLDHDGRILAANRAVNERLGYDLDELKGMNVLDLHPSELAGATARAFGEIKAGKEDQCEIPVIAKDGSRISVETRLSKGVWAGKDVLFGICSDITERMQAEARLRLSETRFRELFDNMANGVVVFEAYDNGRNFVFKDCNKATEHLNNIRKEDLIGRSIFDAISDAGSSGFSGMLMNVWKTGETEQFPYIKYFDGQLTMWRDSYAYRLPSGEIVVVYNDLTSQKIAEEGIIRRDAIMEAVTFGADRFLMSSALDLAVPPVLERAGNAAGVSRVYLFENHWDDDGALYLSHKYEWVAPGVKSLVDEPFMKHFQCAEMGFGRWVDILRNGEPVRGTLDEFPDDEKVFLEKMEIKSILAVPIFAGDKWWGFIGFDECSRSYVWSQAEVDALKTLAGIVGSAILRRETDEALLAYISTAMMRLKSPANQVICDLKEISLDLTDPDTEADELRIRLQVQIKKMEQVVENLYELNTAIFEGKTEIPDIYRAYFLQKPV